jgi:hypothetical protein
MDCDDGIRYDDWMVMKDIDCSLMVIWSVIVYKDYKIGVEGTVVLKVTLNKNPLVKEALKKLRKNYELGSDVVLMDMNSKKYEDNERVYKYRKNLWLGRKRDTKPSEPVVWLIIK